MLKILHSKYLRSGLLFFAIFVALKAPYFFAIPAPLGLNDFPFLKYLIPYEFIEVYSIVIALVVQFFLCLWLNYLINKLEIVDTYSYIPATTCAIVMSIFNSYHNVSVLYVPLILLFLILQLLLSIKKEKPSIFQCFYCGFVLGIITIVIPTFVIILPFLHAALYISKKQGIKSYILYYLGFITPIYFFYSVCFLLDYKIIDGTSILHTFGYYKGTFDYYDYAIISIFSVLTFVSTIFTNMILSSLTFGKRQIVQALLLFGFSIVIATLIFNTPYTNIFIMLTPPLALLISIFLLRIKKQLPAEIAFGIFVLGIVILSIIR